MSDVQRESTAKSIAKFFYRRFRRAWLPLRSPIDRDKTWREGLPDEIDHWARFLALEQAEWKADFARRTDPHAAIIDPLLTAALDASTSENVSILDVGAGPLSVVGTSYPGKRISLTPVDPLADEYDVLLHENGVIPPVRTTKCRAEDLAARFPPGTFDIAYASNCLDHSSDPINGIKGMLDVVKRTGVVLLRHKVQEAENIKYYALHQWNFDRQGGHFIMWGRGVRHDVTALLANRAAVACHIDGPFVVCTIKLH